MSIARGIADTANAIGMRPQDLATIISYETGGTFDPKKAGPTTKWGQHRGLIQFGEPQARKYGVDWQDPINSQLGANGAVAKYFKASGWKPGMDILNAYSIVNAGSPGKFNASDTAAGGAPGTVRDKVQNQFAPHARKAAQLMAGIGGGMDKQQSFDDIFGGSWQPSNRYAPKQADAKPSNDHSDIFGGTWQPSNRYAPKQADANPDQGGMVAPSTAGGFNPNPISARNAAESTVVAPKVDALSALVAGGLRGLADLPVGLNELNDKIAGYNPLTMLSDYVSGGRVSKMQKSASDAVKNLDKSYEADYQQKYGDSGAATIGRVGGNIGTAFIPGTGQIKAMGGIGNLVKAGKYGKAALGGAALGGAQSAALSGGDPTATALGIGLGGIMPVLPGLVPKLPSTRAGQAMARTSGLSADDLATVIGAGNREIIPGLAPTTAQSASGNVGMARMQKLMQQKDAGGATSQALSGQDVARVAELDRVFGAGTQSADSIGNEIAQRATAGRTAAKQQASNIYNDPVLQSSVASPTGGAMDAYNARFTAMGSSLGGNAELKTIASVLDSNPQIPFPELQKMYARTGSIGHQAAISGDTDAAAVANALRQKMNDAMQGNQLFADAKTAHSAAMTQYDKGWTGDIFKTGRDNMPKLSGAQIPNAAFRGGADGLERAQAFTRMVGGDQPSLDLIKQYAKDTITAKGTAPAQLDNMLSRYKAPLSEIAPDSANLAADAARAAGVQRAAAAAGSDTAQNIMTLAGLDKGFARKLFDNVGVRAVGAYASHGATEAVRALDDVAQSRLMAALDDAMADPVKAQKILGAYSNAMTKRGVAAKTGLLVVPASQGLLDK